MATARIPEEPPLAEIIQAAARGGAEGGNLRERVATLENNSVHLDRTIGRFALDLEKNTAAVTALAKAFAEAMAANGVRFAVGSKAGGWVMGIAGAVMGSVLTAAIVAAIMR